MVKKIIYLLLVIIWIVLIGIIGYKKFAYQPTEEKVVTEESYDYVRDSIQINKRTEKKDPLKVQNGNYKYNKLEEALNRIKKQTDE